jgi:Xaa-Pro aminopeptidase
MIDGWLLFDFRGSNPIALRRMGLSPDTHLTRRLFYWIPTTGTSTKLVHKIEAHHLDHLPGETLTYATWQELDAHLATLLSGAKTIAMEVDPDIPYISKVDAGTYLRIRRLGVDIVSSASLIQNPLTESQLDTHRQAAHHLVETVHRAHLFIRDTLQSGNTLTELDVQEFLLAEFAALDLITDHPPICATGPNSADPHHSPDSSLIEPGHLVLIDLWGKLNQPDAIFADFTHVAVADKTATSLQQEIFTLVAQARDAALARLQKPAQGFELDRAARDVIEKAGYGEFFIHRTGHNISTDLHGPGTHLDDYETHDSRPLQPNTCFSIEPGIYLPGQFGIRLECNVLLTPDLEVTGAPQKNLPTLFSEGPNPELGLPKSS